MYTNNHVNDINYINGITCFKSILIKYGYGQILYVNFMFMLIFVHEGSLPF